MAAGSLPEYLGASVRLMAPAEPVFSVSLRSTPKNRFNSQKIFFFVCFLTALLLTFPVRVGEPREPPVPSREPPPLFAAGNPGPLKKFEGASGGGQEPRKKAPKKAPKLRGDGGGLRGWIGGRPGFPENELVEFLGVHGRGNPLENKILPRYISHCRVLLAFPFGGRGTAHGG